MLKNLNPKQTRVKPKRLMQAARLFLFMLLGTGTCFAYAGYSQDATFTLNMSNCTVKEVFAEIEKSSDYIFFYLDSFNHLDRKVSVNVTNQPVNVVLDQVFSGTDAQYHISERQIMVSQRAPAPATQSPQNQTITVAGVVSDENGPLVGASVTVQGTTRVSITNQNGQFSLDGVSPNGTLEVSFPGYATQEIAVDGRTSILILMEPAEVLDDVVITAFGTGQRKVSVVGSVQMVQPTDLVVPGANLTSSFAGRLAGVVSYQRSGEPGKNEANFFIRGVSTMSGILEPLIILDGVEVSPGDLDALDPEIIEGFSILKDATATAMYGTRGANGVMIIKTKSGVVSERPIIGLRVETYTSMPNKIPKFVDGASYMELYNEAVTNQQTGNVLYSQEEINNTRNKVNPYLFPDVDWYDEIFKSATFNQKVNFNIRGGTQKIVYFMNIGFNHENGMLKNCSQDYFSFKNNIDLMRYSFQNNIDFHMTKSSTISLHLNVQLADLTAPTAGVDAVYGAIMNNNPVDFPVSFPGDDVPWVKWGAWIGGNIQGASNPMAELVKGYNNQFESTVMANLDFNQKLDFVTKGLSFKALISFKNYNRSTTARSQGYNKYSVSDYTLEDDGTYSYNLTPAITPTKPVLETTSGVSGDRRIYGQAYLDYTRSFDRHHVNAMALWNIDQYNNNTPGADALNTLLINSLPRRKMGYAARLSYDFDHRYLFEVNAGYNGSENFAQGHKWGFFPSVAVGWNISSEKFFEPLSRVVNNLKLRASYGLVGNDQIILENVLVRFIYLSQINLTGSASYKTGFGSSTYSTSGPVYTRYQNDNITWEVGEKLNVGMDIQLFNSLSITFDGFREIRRDIFQQRTSIPNYLGTAATRVYGNLAEVKNWGFDLSVDYLKRINNDLDIQFKGTFTFARNNVIKYDEAPGLRKAMSQVGKTLYTNRGYVANGLYIDWDDIAHNPASTLGSIIISPGDIKYVDQPDANGYYDGRITSDDRIYMGYPTVPEIVYGFGPSIRWRKWDFSLFFQGVANTSLMMSGFHPFGAQYNRNVLDYVAADYWTDTNQNINAGYPRLTKDENFNNTQPSTYWLRSGAFLKLKNAEIGFSPTRHIRIYVNGTNLATFSPFKHWDPEMGGGRGLSYPTQRMLNLGVQMTFR